MGWSDAFRARLAAGEPYRHRVRSLPGPVGAEQGTQPWAITSGAESLGVVIADEGSSSAGAHLDVPSWQSSIGGFTIALAGDARPLLQRIWRGQFVVHEVSFDGSAWEPVQMGVVDDLHGTDRGRWALDCLDGLAALRSRYTTAEREQPLFSLYGLTDAEDEDGLTSSRTVLSEQYGPGAEPTIDAYNASTSLYGDTDGGRLAVISPTLSNPFFVRYTGTTSSTLTGCTDGVYGTTARVRSPGTIVQAVPFVEGHPCEIVRKILVSNGRSSDTPTAAENGPYNTLPRTWGYGIPDHLVDHEDIADWVRLTSPASGSAAWSMICEKQQTDGLGYLQGWLNRGGYFLAIRQGRYTVRAVVDPAGMSEALAGTATSFGRLSGRYVVPGSLRWSAWGGSSSVEYRRIRVYTGSASPMATSEVTDVIRSQPCEDEYPVPLQDTIWSNERAHQRLILQRLAPWVLTLAEKLELEVDHPLAKGLAVGDILLLDMAHFGGRDVTSNGGVYDSRAAMVVGVDPDWFHGAPTKLVLATPPPQWWRS